MRTENKGGDTLASGGTRCQFRPAGSRMTQEDWDKMWEPEVTDGKNDSRDANVAAPGDAGAQSGETQPDATGC